LWPPKLGLGYKAAQNRVNSFARRPPPAADGGSFRNKRNKGTIALAFGALAAHGAAMSATINYFLPYFLAAIVLAYVVGHIFY
jgi:hypothetical protein